MKSYSNQRRLSLIFRYVLLTILAILWILPIVWIVLASFSYNDTGFVSTFWPEQFTLQNYIGIFTNPQYPFGNWIINTLVVSIASMIVSTFLTISVAYVLSRLRFRFRKLFLQIALVLGMFPGFMSMIALYYILKGLNMLNLFGLFLVLPALASTLLKDSSILFLDQSTKLPKSTVLLSGKYSSTLVYHFQSQ